MNEKILGIGAWDFAKGEKGRLKTFALGSCVAVILHDPILKLSVMAHIALPDSNHDPEKKRIMPGYFADSAIGVMTEYMNKNLCDFNRVNAKIFGGARVLKNMNVFDVGYKNLEAVQSILKTRGIPLVSQDTGSDYSRTVTAFSNDGSILLSARGKHFYY